MALLALLSQFLFRLSFGLALAMAVTSSRLVPSGYFRVHLYVLMGLNVLAAAVALGSEGQYAWWPPVAAAVLSYVGSVMWLYELPRAGKAALVLVALVTLIGAWLSLAPLHGSLSPFGWALWGLDPLTGGLLLGTTMAAMLLGHWYLNTPTMQLEPLRRLVVLIAAAVVLRAVVCGGGLALDVAASGWGSQAHVLFLVLRWAAGIGGTLAVAALTWATLKIPNTQSATGILYVGVIVSFLGELSGQLLSAEALYPL